MERGRRVIVDKRPASLRCPTCKRYAVWLVVPWWAQDGDWRVARCNRCAGDEAFDSDEYKAQSTRAAQQEDG